MTPGGFGHAAAGNRGVPARNEPTCAQDHGALDRIPELAHVAGPLMPNELIACILRDARGRTSYAGRDILEERIGEQQDVVRSIAQGR